MRGLEGPKWKGGAGPDDTTRVDWLLRRTVEPWVQWMRAHCEDRISESNIKLRREFCLESRCAHWGIRLLREETVSCWAKWVQERS